MSTPVTFIKQGVRYRFFKTHANRWSNGKVHLQFWSKPDKQYALVCKPNDVGAFSGYYGMALEEEEPLTCKSCIKKDPRG